DHPAVGSPATVSSRFSTDVFRRAEYCAAAAAPRNNSRAPAATRPAVAAGTAPARAPLAGKAVPLADRESGDFAGGLAGLAAVDRLLFSPADSHQPAGQSGSCPSRQPRLDVQSRQPALRRLVPLAQRTVQSQWLVLDGSDDQVERMVRCVAGRLFLRASAVLDWLCGLLRSCVWLAERLAARAAPTAGVR